MIKTNYIKLGKSRNRGATLRWGGGGHISDSILGEGGGGGGAQDTFSH